MQKKNDIVHELSCLVKNALKAVEEWSPKKGDHFWSYNIEALVLFSRM